MLNDYFYLEENESISILGHPVFKMISKNNPTNAEQIWKIGFHCLLPNVAAMEECGAQGVAWGECGLDYFRRGMDIEADANLRVRMREVCAQQERLVVRGTWSGVAYLLIH